MSLEAEMLTRAVTQTIKSTFVTDKYILLPLGMRIQQTAEFWETGEGLEYASLAQPFTLLKSLTDMLKQILGEETVKCLQRNNRTLRDFLELSTPTTQCQNTIGTYDNCWICGGGISSGNFGPECEHVFPIAQALVFTGLYEHKLFEQISDNENLSDAAAYISGLKKEYKWAHKICNQVKNDSHFITYDGLNFNIDDEKIVVFINKIITTDKWGGGNKLCRYLGNGDIRVGTDILYGRVNDIRKACTSIIEIVASLGLTPKIHAQSTALYLKRYVASQSTCGVEEIIEKTKPTILASAGLPLLTVDADNAIAKHTLNKCCNQLFGKYSELLDNTRRSLGIDVKNKGIIEGEIINIENQFRLKIAHDLIQIIPQLRNKLMIYLQRGTRNASVLWSSYQVLSSQILAVIVIQYTCLEFNNSITELINAKMSADMGAYMNKLLYNPLMQDSINDLTNETQNIYHILFKTNITPSPNVMIANTLRKINEIINIQPLSTNASPPDFFMKEGGRLRRKVKGRKRIARKTRKRNRKNSTFKK